MNYVIVGNGVAGTTAASAIRKTDSNGKITVISDEPYPFYSRIRLVEFLANDLDANTLTVKKESWYIENNISLILNTSVSRIDPDKKDVVLSSGETIKYDKLLLATGGLSFVPPIPGSGKKGVFTLRTLKDAIAIRDFANASNHRIIFVGGGILGLESGNSLIKTGNMVSVVEHSQRLLPRQMDMDGAEILKKQMEKMGFSFYLGVKTKEITGNEYAKAIIFENGETLDCDMIIISAGVRPNISLAEQLGLKIEKGLIVNNRMETEIPGIYAAGDLIQHNGIYYGIWPSAEKQGEIAGINMSGIEAQYQGTTRTNRLKITGIDLLSIGNIDPEGKKESIVMKDIQNCIYKKLVIEDNKIIGAILYGDQKDMNKILNAISNSTDISNIRTKLELWDFEKL